MSGIPGDVLRMVADMLNVEPDMVRALIVSGVAGAFVRAVVMPEPEWRLRLAKGVGGVLCALFVGGIVGHMVDAATGAGTYAFLAAGFVMGEGGLTTMYVIRDRILGGKR